MEKWSLSPVFVCAECDAELCLSCFVRMAEPGKHLKTHAYRIRSARPEVVADNWAACDDLSMLSAIERLGLGNWTDVARAVGRGHSAEDVESHYLELYASRPGSYLPARVKLRSGDWAGNVAGVDEREEKIYVRERLAETMNEQELIAHQISLPGAELLGYMPLRGDFDVEHDNEAEATIADMEFLSDDDPADRELKRQVLRAYNARLAERERRKRYLIERNLLDRKHRLELQRGMSPQQRRVQVQLKGFAPFHSTQAHQKLVDSLVETSHLADRMIELKRRIDAAAKADAKNGAQGNAKKKQKPSDHLAAMPSMQPTMTNNLLLPTSNKKLTQDHHFLSDLEVKLCDALQLPPRKYLEVKEALSVRPSPFLLSTNGKRSQTNIFNGRGTAAA